jgi:hypothetical protein
MKNSRKKDLRLIREEIMKLNGMVIEKMQEIQCSLEEVVELLNEQFDNLSERSQNNEVGEKIEDDIQDVEYIISDVADIAESDSEDAEVSIFASIIEQIDTLLDKE